MQNIPDTFLTSFLLDAIKAARCLFLLKAVVPFHPLLPAQSNNDQQPIRNFRLRFTEDSASYFVSFQQYEENMKEKLAAVSQKELKQKNFSCEEEPSALSFRSIFGGEEEKEQESKPEEIFAKNWKSHHSSFKAIIHRNILPVIDIQ